MRNEKVMKEVFIFIGYTIALYCIVIIISSSYRLYRRSIESNKFHNNYTVIQMQSTSDKSSNTFNEIINNFTENKMRNFSTLEMDISIIKSDYIAVAKLLGIYDNLDFSTYGKLEGRAFEKEELLSGRKVAIIGDQEDSNVEIIDNQKYIKIFEEYYKVIGVLKGNEYLKYHIFVPMNSLEILKNKSKTFSFMIESKDIDKLNNLSSNFNIKYDEINPIDIKQEIIEKLPQIKGYAMDLILAICNLMLFSILFTKDLNREISIMRILGAKNIHVIKMIFYKLSKLAIIAIPISLLLSQLTISYVNKIVINSFSNLNIFIIAISLSLALLIILFTITITCYNSLKFNVLKELR